MAEMEKLIVILISCLLLLPVPNLCGIVTKRLEAVEKDSEGGGQGRNGRLPLGFESASAVQPAYPEQQLPVEYDGKKPWGATDGNPSEKLGGFTLELDPKSQDLTFHHKSSGKRGGEKEFVAQIVQMAIAGERHPVLVLQPMVGGKSDSTEGMTGDEDEMKAGRGGEEVKSSVPNFSIHMPLQSNSQFQIPRLRFTMPVMLLPGLVFSQTENAKTNTHEVHVSLPEPGEEYKYLPLSHIRTEIRHAMKTDENEKVEGSVKDKSEEVEDNSSSSSSSSSSQEEEEEQIEEITDGKLDEPLSHSINNAFHSGNPGISLKDAVKPDASQDVIEIIPQKDRRNQQAPGSETHPLIHGNPTEVQPVSLPGTPTVNTLLPLPLVPLEHSNVNYITGTSESGIDHTNPNEQYNISLNTETEHSNQNISSESAKSDQMDNNAHVKSFIASAPEGVVLQVSETYGIDQVENATNVIFLPESRTLIPPKVKYFYASDAAALSTTKSGLTSATSNPPTVPQVPLVPHPGAPSISVTSAGSISAVLPAAASSSVAPAVHAAIDPLSFGTVPAVPTIPVVPPVPDVSSVPGQGTVPALGSVPTLPNFPYAPTVPKPQGMPTESSNSTEVHAAADPTPSATVPAVPTIPVVPPVPDVSSVPDQGTAPTLGSVPALPNFPYAPTVPKPQGIPAGSNTEESLSKLSSQLLAILSQASINGTGKYVIVMNDTTPLLLQFSERLTHAQSIDLTDINKELEEISSNSTLHKSEDALTSSQVPPPVSVTHQPADLNGINISLNPTQQFVINTIEANHITNLSQLVNQFTSNLLQTINQGSPGNGAGVQSYVILMNNSTSTMHQAEDQAPVPSVDEIKSPNFSVGSTQGNTGVPHPPAPSANNHPVLHSPPIQSPAVSQLGNTNHKPHQYVAVSGPGNVYYNPSSPTYPLRPLEPFPVPPTYPLSNQWLSHLPSHQAMMSQFFNNRKRVPDTSSVNKFRPTVKEVMEAKPEVLGGDKICGMPNNGLCGATCIKLGFLQGACVFTEAPSCVCSLEHTQLYGFNLEYLPDIREGLNLMPNGLCQPSGCTLSCQQAGYLTGFCENSCICGKTQVY